MRPPSPPSRRRSTLVSRKPAASTAAAAPAAATLPPVPLRSPSRTGGGAWGVRLPEAGRCARLPAAWGRFMNASLCTGNGGAGSSGAPSSSLLYATRLMSAAQALRDRRWIDLAVLHWRSDLLRIGRCRVAGRSEGLWTDYCKLQDIFVQCPFGDRRVQRKQQDAEGLLVWGQWLTPLALHRSTSAASHTDDHTMPGSCFGDHGALEEVRIPSIRSSSLWC